jgi:hypothetical protein
MMRLPSITMRPVRRILAAASLLLAGAGAYQIGIRRLWPAWQHPAATSGSLPAAGARIASAGNSEGRSMEVKFGSTPPAERKGHAGSAARDERTILMSREAMDPDETVLASLDLPPDRLRRLKELIVAREESAGDAEALSKEHRLDPGNTAIARTEAEAAFDQEIADVVGSPNDRKVFAMLSLAPQLADINQTVGSDLAAMDDPLTAEQLLQLAHAYKDAFASPPTGAPAFIDRTAGFDPQTGLAYADQRILARASAVLTPQQLDILQIGLAKTTVVYAKATQ